MAMKLVCGALMTLASYFALGSTEKVNGIVWVYSVVDGAVVIGGLSTAVPTSTQGAITIPSVLGGLKVTCIANDAFSRCIGLTSVAIPIGVTNIGERAFYNCSDLTSVTVPSSVKQIGKGAFFGCNGLTEVRIDDLTAWCNIIFGSENANPLILSPDLYLKDEKITKLVIPNDVKNVLRYAFYGCTNLTSLIVSSNVTSIGRCAFQNCSGLGAVHIPECVTNIDEYAFLGCSGLGDGVVTVDGCVLTVNGLCPAEVVLPAETRLIANAAFRNCESMKSINLALRA